jgi:outer membrane protein assembly factor BamB
VNITTVCPHCQTSYQVPPSLIGTRIKCPNALCQKPFEVREASTGGGAGSRGATDASASSPPRAGGRREGKLKIPVGPTQVAGSVGEIVPILSAQAVPPPAASRDRPAAGGRPPVPEPPSPSPVRQIEEDVGLVPIEEDEPVAEAEPESVPEARPVKDHASYQKGPPPRRGPAKPPKPPRASAPPAGPRAPAEGDTADWRNAPPPARGGGTEVPAARTSPPASSRPPASNRPPPPPRPTGPSPQEDQPAEADRPGTAAGEPEIKELPPGAWEAPPVRHAALADTPGPAEQAAAHARKKRRRMLLIMVSMPLLVGLILGGIFLHFWVLAGQAEEQMRTKAETDFNSGQYANASGTYKNLLKQFPESTRAAEYRFLQNECDLLSQIGSVTSTGEATLEKTNEFLRQDEALLKQHGGKAGEGLVKWLQTLAKSALDKKSPLQLEFMAKAEETLADAGRLLPDSVTDDGRIQIAKAFEENRILRGKSLGRKATLELVKELGKKPSLKSLREARRLIDQQNRVDAEFKKENEAPEVVAKLQKDLFDQVHYVPVDRPVDEQRGAEDLEQGLLVDQLVQGNPPVPQPNAPQVLALVRGVLYALSQTNGHIEWAVRVGIDTSRLPLRVPPSSGRPERILALSSDTASLMALDAHTGAILWRHTLSAPCVAQPVVVEQRAYVPTYDGFIHEIELANGQELGYYQLDPEKGEPRLTIGGALQEGTSLVYFPADDLCVYVLDVAAKKCQAILYSDHASGSLRSEPILASNQGEELDAQAPQGFLILPLTDGLDTMRLRAFGLPLQGAAAPAPLGVQKEPRVRGWPWFQPYHDPEKIVLVTDKGVVGWFGIKQLRTQDSHLFPMLAGEVLVGGPAAQANADGTGAGRAQVVSSQGDDLWLLAFGGLQKLSFRMDPKSGPRLAVDSLWQEPLLLGSPLHRSQTDASESTFFLVTQSLTRNACLATAVPSDKKAILWQRQLGLICQGDPVQLGQDVLALDQGGGVLGFHPENHPPQAKEQWQVGGQTLATPHEDNPAFLPSLHLGGDGATAYEVSCPGKGNRLVIRRFRRGDGGKLVSEDADEKTVELGSRPAGMAAVGPSALLLPLQDGTLARVRLPVDGNRPIPGPGWRTSRSAADAQSFVVWINAEEFLTTDGSRGLTHWRWPEGKTYAAVPAEKLPTTELRARISFAPVVLPRKDDKAPLEVCVADVDGGLTLLQGDRLEEARRWEVGGKITTGPFVRGGGVGCVVDRSRLLWFDPSKKEPAWEYATNGEEIVGQPQLIEGMLVMADRSGRFLALDPATGKAQGKGYTLKANVAPAASPVAFGTGRAFTPLTDGTVLLLTLQNLREK